MKGIEVKFTLDIKLIIIIILALWLLFSGIWVYKHVIANEKGIQGNTSSVQSNEKAIQGNTASIQAVVNYLNSQQVQPRPQIPQIPKEVKKNGK